MDRESARKQFNEMTEKHGIEHTFSFDEAWDFVEYKRSLLEISKPLEFLPANYTPNEFREAIFKVENNIKKSTKGVTGEDVNRMNPLRNSFADGCYVREVFNPAGALIITKIHKVEHPFFLLKGDMSILSEKGETRLQAPHYGITKPGTKRMIFCHTDCVFVTVHVTKETDLEKIEKEIIAESFDEIKNNEVSV